MKCKLGLGRAYRDYVVQGSLDTSGHHVVLCLRYLILYVLQEPRRKTTVCVIIEASTLLHCWALGCAARVLVSKGPDTQTIAI